MSSNRVSLVPLGVSLGLYVEEASQNMELDVGQDPHAGMDSQEFMRELEHDVQPIPPPAVASAADAPAPMDVEKQASAYQDPLMRQFANIMYEKRPKVSSEEEREAKEKLAKENKEREEHLTKPNPEERDQEFGRVALRDIADTKTKKFWMEIPNIGTVDENDLKKLIRECGTVVSYALEDGESVTCPLADKPADIEEEDYVKTFTMRDGDQVENAVDLIKLMHNHGAALLTSPVGSGKTVTTVVTGRVMVDLGLAAAVAIVMPKTLTEAWTECIRVFGGAGSETFFVTSETIKDADRLLYDIHASKSPRKYIIVSEPLMSNVAHTVVLDKLFSAFEGRVVVFTEEIHERRRDNSSVPTTMHMKIFGKHRNCYISGTPLIRGGGKEEAAFLTAVVTTVDIRAPVDARGKPREHTRIDPRMCSASQRQKIIKALSASRAPPPDTTPPPGAIYRVKVNPTVANIPRGERSGNGINYGVHQRLLAAIKMALHIHLRELALKKAGIIEEAGSVLVAVSNVKAVGDMAKDLAGMGYAEKVIIFHGQMSAADRSESLRRMMNEPGLIVVCTPESTRVGLNLQYTFVAIVSACEGYVGPDDIQLEGRIDRYGRTRRTLVIYITSGVADERATALQHDKMVATSDFYEGVDTLKEAWWPLEPLRSIDEKEIPAITWGMYAAAEAGYAVCGECFAPHHRSKLHPPKKEQMPELMNALKAFVCLELVYAPTA